MQGITSAVLQNLLRGAYGLFSEAYLPLQQVQSVQMLVTLATHQRLTCCAFFSAFEGIFGSESEV
jgi:hypothetical protein